MAELGHNIPPDMAETAITTSGDLSAWMAEHPIIETEDQAREAKVFIDRGSLCIKDLEAERGSKVAPLNQRVKQINEYYRHPRELIGRVLDELKSRMDEFLFREEEKRQAAIEEARRVADEAERIAREAERLEQEAIKSAQHGELGIDIAAATAQADKTFSEYEKTQRNLARAERDAHVKVGGGFARATSLKSREVIVLVDPLAAVREIGFTEAIRDAIIKSARAYEKINGRYPSGVEVQIERKS